MSISRTMRIMAVILSAGILAGAPGGLAQDDSGSSSGGSDYDLCPQPPLLGGIWTCSSLDDTNFASSVAETTPETEPQADETPGEEPGAMDQPADR